MTKKRDRLIRRPTAPGAGDFAGLLMFLRFYFGADLDALGAILEDLATRRIVALAEPQPGDDGRLLRISCARPHCVSVIDVPDDPDRAAARMNVQGWISTDDDRPICPRCVPRAMRAGLA